MSLFNSLVPTQWKRLRVKHMGAYAAVYAGNTSVIFATLLCFYIVRQFDDAEDFAKYALARRTISFATPVLLLGLCPALVRSIAADKDASPSAARAKLIATFSCAAITCFVIGVIACVADQQLAVMLWGDGNLAPLILAILPWLAGTVCHGVATAYLQGHLQFGRAAFLNAVNLAMVPTLAVLLAPNLETAIVSTGVAMTLVSGVLLVTLAIRTPQNLRAQDFVTHARALLGYGLPRLPGDLSLSLLLYLPVALTANWYGIDAGGEVAIAITIVGLMQAAVKPIGSVLLPHATQLLAKQHFQELSRHIKHLALFILGTTGSASILLACFASPLMRLYLNSESTFLIAAVRIVAISTIPLNLFFTLRSLNDAAFYRPVTALICFCGLAVTWVAATSLHLGDSSGLAPLFGFFLGALTLACMTLAFAHRILKGGELTTSGFSPTPSSATT